MAVEDCLRKSGSQVFIIGPTKIQTSDIVNGLLPLIMEDCPKGMMTATKSERKWQFSNGSQLIISGFDTALESMRGKRADSIYLEESGLANPDDYEYIISSVLFPTLMHSRGKIIHLTTPAFILDHPLHLKTIPKAQSSGAYFKYTIRDNPLLSDDQIESEIYNLGGLSSSHCQRELFCNIVRDENITVVPQFDERKHVAEVVLPDNAHYWVAGDIGGVRDKSVLLLCAYDYNTGKLHVVKEAAFDSKTPTTEIVKGGFEMEGGRTVNRAVDAPGQLFIDLSSVYGYSCYPPEKLHFDQNIIRLQTAFWKDEIIVDPSCKLLIATLNSGQLNKQRTDFNRTESLGHCDAMAALVYGLRYADKRVPLKPAATRRTEDRFGIQQTQQGDSLEESLKLLRGSFNDDDEEW